MNTFAKETSTGHFSLLPLYLKQIERSFFPHAHFIQLNLQQNSAEGKAHEMTKAKHISHITHHYIDYLADGYLQVSKSVNISAL